MKLKRDGFALLLGLGLPVVVAGIAGCATGPDLSGSKRVPANPNPTWGGDQHDPPVYTSPATAPENKDLSAERPPP